MESKILATSADGAIEYRMLTERYLSGALLVMRNSFFKYETVSVAVELPLHPEAIAELDELVLCTIRDGVSIVAVDKSTGNVIGGAFNKIYVPKTSEDDKNYLPNYRDSCRTPEAQALVQFMINIDNECDLFELLNIDCIMEIMFLATLPDYLGQGIARKLHELSIDAAKKLFNEENIKKTITGDNLILGTPPKAVCAYYTSFVTQKMGEKFGFVRAASVSFDKWSYKGKLFSESIGTETPNATIDYLLFK